MPKRYAKRAPRSDRFDTKLARVYRELRGPGSQTRLNISQLDLARRLDCDPRTIASIEHRFIMLVRAKFAELGCERLSDIRFTD